MASVEEDIYDIVADKADVPREKLERDARLDDLEIESLDIVEIIGRTGILLILNGILKCL